MDKESLKTAFASFLEEQGNAQPSNAERLSDRMLEYISKNAGSTRADIERGLGIEQGSFYYGIRRLKNSKKIVVVGNYNKRYYVAGTVDIEAEEKKPVDLLGEYCEKILQFVSDNMGKTYSIREMSEKLKIPYGSMHRPINDLKKRKLLPDNFNRGSEVLTPARKTTTPIAKTPAKAIGSLIWEFVRETRSTDVLQFLTWLEKK